MPDIVGVYTSKSGKKKATIIKVDDVKYDVLYEKETGPTGDLGYKKPKLGIPEEMYIITERNYNLQFNSMVIPFSSKHFKCLPDALEDVENFLYEAAE